MPKGINGKKWWVLFRPDKGIGVHDRDIGPFPFQAWALGWAFMELNHFPMSWWHVKKMKKD